MNRFELAFLQRGDSTQAQQRAIAALIAAVGRETYLDIKTDIGLADVTITQLSKNEASSLIDALRESVQ